MFGLYLICCCLLFASCCLFLFCSAFVVVGGGGGLFVCLFVCLIVLLSFSSRNINSVVPIVERDRYKGNIGRFKMDPNRKSVAGHGKMHEYPCVCWGRGGGEEG